MVASAIATAWSGITTVGGWIAGGPAAIITPIMGPIGRGLDRLLGNRNWQNIAEDNLQVAGRQFARGVRVLRDDLIVGTRFLTVELRDGIRAIHEDGRDLAEALGQGGRVVYGDVVDGVQVVHLELAAGVQVAYRDARGAILGLHDDLRAVAEAAHEKITQLIDTTLIYTVAGTSLVASGYFLVCGSLVASGAAQVIGVVALGNALRVACNVKLANVTTYILRNETLQKITSEVSLASLKGLGVGLAINGSIMANSIAIDPSRSGPERLLASAASCALVVIPYSLIKQEMGNRPTQQVILAPHALPPLARQPAMLLAPVAEAIAPPDAAAVEDQPGAPQANANEEPVQQVLTTQEKLERLSHRQDRLRQRINQL